MIIQKPYPSHANGLLYKQVTKPQEVIQYKKGVNQYFLEPLHLIRLLETVLTPPTRCK